MVVEENMNTKLNVMHMNVLRITNGLISTILPTKH